MEKKEKQYPSQERLRELFDYDPAGFLVWRDRKDIRPCINSRLKGKKAGSLIVDKDNTPQYRILVDGRSFSAIKLIWVYFNESIPEGFIACRKDTDYGFRIENLIITRKVIKRNPRGYSAKNKYIGVYKKKTSFGWNCTIGDGKEIVLRTQISAAIFHDNYVEDRGGGRPNFTIRENVDCEIITKKISRYMSFANRLKSKGSMIGVYKHKNGHDFIARCAKVNIKGRFETQIEAARAYNIAAREKYGEHAVLNDIPDPLGEGAPI